MKVFIFGWLKSLFDRQFKFLKIFVLNTVFQYIPQFKCIREKRFESPKYKHFHKGSIIGNTLLTRIRVGRSYLNQHKSTIGFSDTPECICHFKTESPEHYFLDCFLYNQERQRMFSLIEHYVSNFLRLNKKQKLYLILNGVDPENIEFTSTNTTIYLIN